MQLDPRERLVAFKSALATRTTTNIVRQFVITGTAALLSEELYFNLRSEVAERFSLHPTEVLIVGSAKLGFSIAPKKRYRPFNDSSDVDVAIVSDRLFDDIWRRAHAFSASGGYWEEREQFKKYVFDGWIRPDKLPPERSFATAVEWWNFFREMTLSNRYGPYKVRGALYKSWYFLEKYQERAVSQCIDDLRRGV